MHYRGFAIVPEPTVEAIAEVMAPFGEDGEGRWDWYRCGGRYDGYLVSDDEMTRRETHDGFNFDDANDDPARNSVRVADLPADRRDVYFVTDGASWLERETYDPAPVEGKPFGRIVPADDFEADLGRMLVARPGAWVVVVDAHN